jgi:hypothetical protein
VVRRGGDEGMERGSGRELEDVERVAILAACGNVVWSRTRPSCIDAWPLACYL